MKHHGQILGATPTYIGYIHATPPFSHAWPHLVGKLSTITSLFVNENQTFSDHIQIRLFVSSTLLKRKEKKRKEKGKKVHPSGNEIGVICYEEWFRRCNMQNCTENHRARRPASQHVDL